MAELLALFAAWQADVDSMPFEHEDFWTDRVGELREEENR